MKQRYSSIVLSLLIFVMLSACAANKAPTAIPTVSLDTNTSNTTSTQTSDADSISASGVVVPFNTARLSFSTIGHVTSVDVKVGDKVKAGEPLVKLDTTIQEARVREAEANLLAAQVQVKYLRRLGVDTVHIETALAEEARTQALLDSANAELASQFVLTAPFDGTIVSLDVAPAENVVPGQVLIVLGDLSKYQIETTDLSERNVTHVQVGQPVTAYIEALGEEFTGTVVDIDRVSSTLGGDVVFKVTIDFDDQPEGLLWGMSADVNIENAD